MKSILLILAITNIMCAYSQAQFTYPVIPSKPEPQWPWGFIPKDWDALAISYGDINRDGNDDYGMILKPLSEKKRYSLLEMDYYLIPSTPKIIIIELWDSVTREEKLFLQNNTFLFVNTDTTIIEPFSYFFVDTSGRIEFGFRYRQKKVMPKEFKVEYKFYFRLIENRICLTFIGREETDLMTKSVDASVLYTNETGTEKLITLDEMGCALDFKLNGQRVLKEFHY